MKLRRSAFVVSLLISMGCATPARVPVAALPPVVEGVFTLCSSGEGGLALSVVHAGKFLGSSQVDWVSERDRTGMDWEAEVRNPLGQVLLNVSLTGTELRAKGGLEDKLKGLKIQPSGFLEVDGHFIGIRAAEIPCLLKFRFPREWVTRVVDVRRLPGRFELDIRPERRRIRVVFDDLSVAPARKICAAVSWSSWLGLVKSVATICHEYDKRKKTTFNIEDLEIRWIDTDDATS